MTATKMKPAQGMEGASRNWGWLLALGFLFVILGTIGLGMVVGLTLVSILFFGILLVIGGALQLIDSFTCRQWKPFLGHIFIAVLYIVAGILVIRDPGLAATVITTFLASILILIGVIRIMMAVSLRGSSGWGWMVLAGLVALALGILILAQWPWSGLWVIGMFIAIDLLVYGWTYIFLAFAIR